MWNFITESFPVIRMALLILIVAAALFLIIVILFQQSNDGGLGAISGETDTYFAKNREKTLDGTMKRLTIILGSTIFVLSILFFLTLVVYQGS